MRFFRFVSLVLLTAAASVFAGEPQRPKRGEAYFGIHLDFHCSLDEQNVGANTTDEMVNKLLDIVDPDFIQIDCKGHPGVSSYPTKVGNPCRHIVGDPLRVWRRVTAERGVPLYMHYSGIWDNRAIQVHPEWGAVNADGSRSSANTSLFSGYTNELFIPQIKELALDYGVDGIWVDGDCWAVQLDYAEPACKEFTALTGIENAPKSKDDPGWNEWMEFHRNKFREHLRDWVNELGEVAPDFQCASNWAFTDHMPEPVSADVAFLSGDFSPTNSVNTARTSARFIASQDKPWDLMAWSFSRADKSEPWSQKNASQIEREAACVLSQGGGFQAYYGQNRDGSVDLEKLAPMNEIGKFCRARKPFCFRSVPVPQVALVFPCSSHYDKVNRETSGLFPNYISWQRGIVSAILENQYSLEIMLDSKLEQRISDYPAIVICEWNTLPPDLMMSAVDYAQNGGSLFLLGETLCSLFDEPFKEISWTASDSDPLLKSGAFGKGRVVEYQRCVSHEYSKEPDPAIRETIGKAMKLTLPNPVVEVTGSGDVDVSLRRTAEGKLSVHLVNTSGPHQAEPFVEKIDPVGPLTVRVKTGTAPSKVVIQPDGKEVSFTYGEDGFTVVELDQIGIYDILVLE